jgi:hypothetical protein
VDDDAKVRVDVALRRWVEVRNLQKETAQAGGRAQEGNRSAVTGGAHLDGLNHLVVEEIKRAGMSDGLTFVTGQRARLAGYYRSSKAWDLAVLKDDKPVLVVEYKSMSGSEGKNLNNRADEVFGVAEDARQAEAHGLLPKDLRRAYVFIMGITSESTRPVAIGHLIGKGDPEFSGASYLQRTAIMCRRLRETGLYDMTWAVGVQEIPFMWHDPDPRVGWDRFASDIHQAFSHHPEV